MLKTRKQQAATLKTQAFINDKMKQQKINKLHVILAPLHWNKPMLAFCLESLECLEGRPKLLITLL